MPQVRVVLGYVSVEPWDPTRRVFPLHSEGRWLLGLIMIRRSGRVRRPRPRTRRQTYHIPIRP